MNLLKKIIFFVGLMIFNIFSSSGQEMWPGDVNNNGVVNGLDMLFLGTAFNATGTPRTAATTDWSPQNITVPWLQSFPNGLNYAYADADGNGTVEENDIIEGIDANFGRTHGVVIPDDFNIGDPDVDPTLELFTVNNIVLPSVPVTFDISLGSIVEPIQDFYGLAFTLEYDPAVLNGEDINFEVAPLSWIDPLGIGTTKSLTKVDETNGLVHVAVTRTTQTGVDGFGPVGSFIIIIEDIIVGLEQGDVNTVVKLDSMWLVNDQMDLLPVVNDSITLTIPMDTMTVDTMMVDTMTVDTMMVDTMTVDTMTVDTMTVDTMTVDTMTVDTMTVDTMTVDTMTVDTMTVDTMTVDTMTVDTMTVDTMTVDTMTVDTMTVDTMTVDTMTVDTMTVDTMTIDTMTVDTMTVDTMTVDTMTVDTMTVDTTTAVQDFLPDKIEVYPNPAKNKVYIEAPDIEIKQLELYDYLGRRIPILHQREQKRQILSIENIPKGLYFISIGYSKGILTKRLIVY